VDRLSLRTGIGIRTINASTKLDYISTLLYGELERVSRATKFDVSLIGRHFRSLEAIGGLLRSSWRDEYLHFRGCVN